MMTRKQHAPPAATVPDAGVALPVSASAAWWNPPGAWACAIAALLTTLFIAAPVLLHPTQRLFGTEIIGRYHDPFTVIAFFEHPTPPTLYTQPATDYLGALVARWTGGVAAYNVVILLSFPLAALFAYLFTFRLTSSRAAAWLTGFCFAFSPFHLAHAAYHPQVAQIQWIPFYFLALWLMIERPGWRRALLFGVALALVSLSNFYAGLIVAVLTPFALIGYWWLAPGGRRPDALRRLAIVGGSLAVLALAGWSYIRLIAPQVLANAGAFAFPSADVQRYTARWWAYLVPPVTHPLFGPRVLALWKENGVWGALVEQQLTLGWGILILAGIALGMWARGRRDGGLRMVPWVGFFTLVAFLCSLPPWWRFGPLTLPGPSALFYRLAPMFRAHARFGVVVGLGASMLAGLGLAALLRSQSRRPRVVAATCLVLAVVELTPVPPWHWRDILPTPAHRWLVDHGAAGETLDCVPAADPAERSSREIFGPQLIQLAPGEDCGSTRLASKLAARGIRHLIVRRASRVGAWFDSRPAPAGLRLVGDFGSALLFDVVAAPAELEVDPERGFYQREYYGPRSYRWMGSEASLRVINRSGSMTRGRLRLELNAFPHPRRVLIAMNGTSSGFTVEAGLEPESHMVGPFELPAGVSTLTISTPDKATIADDVLHNGDNRALALAVGGLELLPTDPARP